MLILATGCPFLGERRSLTRTVSVTLLPAGGPKEAISLPTRNEARRVLQITDGVIFSKGFIRETNMAMRGGDGILAAYSKFVDSDLRLGILPDVYLKDGEAQVVICEIGNRTTKASKLTRDLCTTLQNEFADQYGSKNVRILKGP